MGIASAAIAWFTVRDKSGVASQNLAPRPGYYYRGDHMKLDDENWHCFTLSRYDRNTGDWAMEKAPVYHIID